MAHTYTHQICIFAHTFKVTNGHIHTIQILTQISRESSSTGEMLHRSMGHWIHIFLPPPLLSSLSHSPSVFADSPPHSHFCNLPQLIESQWCENMALWQSVPECKVSHSPFLSFYYLWNVYEDRFKKKRAEIPACGVSEAFNFYQIINTDAVSVVSCWIAEKTLRQTLECKHLFLY